MENAIMPLFPIIFYAGCSRGFGRKSFFSGGDSSRISLISTDGVMTHAQPSALAVCGQGCIAGSIMDIGGKIANPFQNAPSAVNSYKELGR